MSESEWDTRELVELLSEDGSQNWYMCPSGRHWGRFGAAGILPWCRFRGRLYVLLSRRSSMVQDGGVWSTIGGALNGQEAASWAAMRELHEETRLHINLPDIGGSVRWVCPECCGWSYETFVAEVPVRHRLPRAQIRRSASWETTRLRWFPVGQVESMDLHNGLRSVWPALVRLLPRRMS
jgi:8-oxo-dGTP pyrophosphatase MutT (NUDIX family)